MNLLTETIEFPNLFSGDINVNPVAFNIGSFRVYWYGILIALGVVLGFAYALKRAKKVGLISDDVFDVAFISTIFAFIGARAYFCIFTNLWGGGDYNIITMFTEIHDGGLAIYGGIIVAVIVCFIVCKIKKVHMLPLLDIAGAGLLIGQGIGRWGNFINQECYGTATAGNLPWGMTGSKIANDAQVIEAQSQLSDGYALVHPCFLYEFLWCAVGFLIIHFVINKIRTFDGEAFLFYVFWYGAGRGWIEGLRTDSLYIGEYRVSQLVAIASAVIALALYIILKIRLHKKADYVMYVNTDESKERLANYKKNLELKKQEKEGKKAMKKAEAEVAPSILADADDEADNEKTAEVTENKDESENNNG